MPEPRGSRSVVRQDRRSTSAPAQRPAPAETGCTTKQKQTRVSQARRAFSSVSGMWRRQAAQAKAPARESSTADIKNAPTPRPAVPATAIDTELEKPPLDQ